MPRGKVNKLAVRTAYVVKGWPAQKCADEFGVNVTTVKLWASREGWTAERNRNTTQGAQIATDEARMVVADAIATVEAAHAARLSILDDLLATCKQNIAAAKPGRSQQATIKDAMESVHLAFKIERLVLGRTEGQASLVNENDDGRKRIIFAPVDEQESA